MSGPKHVAIIMDGNGRWASALNRSRLYGHQVGAKVFRDIIRESVASGLSELTVFALSTENLSRPQAEIDHIIHLCIHHLQEDLDHLHQQGVALRFIGDVKQLGDSLVASIKKAEQLTQNNQKLTLSVALNFSGREHIVQTIKKLLDSGKRYSKANIHEHLMSLLPSEPDILIRTGGEHRISNFLLYHLAYTEMFFLDVRWPDFTAQHLREVLAAYHKRDRRFGKIKALL